MSTLARRISQAVSELPAFRPDFAGSDKKNYTEALSHRVAEAIRDELREMGVVRAEFHARGRDKQFMGGYGPKGVDVFLSDEKHGLLLTSGVKGLLFDARKNLLNRYRDIVMEALELHRRFPYAVCGHLLFLGREEALREQKKFKSVLGQAVALVTNVSGRTRPEQAPELYEAIGILLVEPGDPASVDLTPEGVPPELQAEGYCRALVDAFETRNPFY